MIWGVIPSKKRRYQLRNRAGPSDGACPCKNRQFQCDPRNRLTDYTKGNVTTPFQYDEAGNLLADDKALYFYDAFNRTVKAETFDGNIQVNRYDAEGLRYEMEENGRLVRFIFNQDREAVAEENDSGLNRLIRGTELIASRSSADSARTYYHYASDEMGSATHIVDEAGAILNRYEYDAWGNITAREEQIPNRFTYYGQQIDPITQQYYLRTRFYNPVVGRFTQEDTYRGDGLNLYTYCNSNPILYTDENGHKPYTKEQLDLFAKWYNAVTREDVESLMAFKKTRTEITNSLRGGGYMHEWLPVSQAAISRGWNVTAEEIWKWTTPTENTFFVDIIDKMGIKHSGFHGGNGSTAAHNQIIAMMKESSDLNDFRNKLNLWADEHVKIVDRKTGTDIAVGRNALPEDLRVPETELAVSPRAIYNKK